MKHKRFLRSVLAMLLSSAMLLTPVLAQGITETVSQLSTPTLSEDEVPAVLDFEEMKAKGHVKRLYAEETEMNQAVFENEDGTRTAYLFTEAIKYVDEDGKTKDKSQKLKSKFTVFENEENDLKVVYNRNLENGIALEYGGLEIEMFPQGIDQNVKSKVVKESKKNLSDSVEYKNAFGNHTTLRYLQNLNGIKEEILLEKETELRSFTFRILTNGAALAEEKGKARIFKGEESFDLGEILMWDSAGKQAKGSYFIETVKEKEEYLLTMDTGDFLDREDLQYPVTVDPSFAVLYQENVVEDVLVYDGYYDYENGANPVMRVGNYDLLDESEKDETESGFLIEEKGNGAALFYLPNITNEYNELYDLFMQGSVISVDLEIAVLCNEESSYVSNFLEAYAVTDYINWNESEMLWEDCFDDGLKKLDRMYVPQLDEETGYSIDITYAVQKRFQGLNSCVILKSTNQSCLPIPIASAEHWEESLRPYLSVTYNTDSFDDQVFRLKHVQSGLYATVAAGVDENETNIDLWTRGPDATVVDGPYSEMDRSQLFRVRYIDGCYTFNPICSGNGYFRRMDIVRDGDSPSHGMAVQIHTAVDHDAEKFNLVSNGEYGQFEIVTSANTSCGLGASQNAAGCQLMIRNRSGNNCLWQLEPAYDYHQIENYYTEMGASYFFNLNDGLGSYETTITSGYGTRASGTHHGVDIGAGRYTNILAPFAAKVTSVGTNASDSRGYHVYIEATDPRFTSFENGKPLRMVFMHMQSSPYVSYGATIAAGTILGQVGSTGDSTGPHLHISLIVTGDAGQTINNTVDPLMLYGPGNLVVDWP